MRPYIILGVAGAILFLAFAVVATIFGWWPVALDLVPVIVVLRNAVMLAVLASAIITAIGAIREMRAEIRPIIGSLGETATTVTEAAKVTRLFGLCPVQWTATVLVSAAGVALVTLGRGNTSRRAAARRRRREEVDQQIVVRAEQSAGRPSQQ
jgi:hypothetical protein